MPTRPPPGASPSDADVPQTNARGATMPAALSASGSTFPLQGGSHQATLSTIMPVGGRYHHGLLILVMPRNRGAAAPLRIQGRRRIETTMSSSDTWNVAEAAYPSADDHTVAGVSEADVAQASAQRTTMLFASSASGSTSPLQGGPHLATLSTTIPPMPTRPPPGAPPPGVLSHCLPEEELSFRKVLGQRILQQGTPLDPKESGPLCAL